jgi:DNA-binding CsgD family transcriptional regulator
VEKSWQRDPGWWQSIGDRALVDALRAGRAEAVDEFMRRFEPLVERQAHVLRIPPEERRHWVGELLYEVAMTLGRGRRDPPRHLGAYVAGACRLRARHEQKTEALYHARVREALEEVYAAGETLVTGLCSESSLRAARGPGWEPPPVSPVLERLVSTFDEGTTDEERRLLRWLAAQISYSMIADWLGITRPAAVSRIQRLRRRLVESALRFGAALDKSDRAELVRFLRRTGVVREERIRALEQSTEDPR